MSGSEVAAAAPFGADDPFCEICQLVLSECRGHLDVITRSLSVSEKKQSVSGDSGDNGLSPEKPPLSRGKRPAVTAVTVGSHRPDPPRNGGSEPGDNAGDNAVAGVTPLAPAAPRATSWTAAGLLGESFTEPRWAIPGLIPEGLTLLCGAPKTGKSWLALDLCVSVASGGRALGSIDVEPGPVLYLALEDTPRRLQRRLRQVLAGSPAPEGFVLAVECPTLYEGGLQRISNHLAQEDNPRLVVIDVLERVRGPAPVNVSAYAADYQAVRAIKSVADEHGVAIILVHHMRKAGSADFLSEISGTLGLPGAADTIAVLKRSRGEMDGTLNITGRDVEEQEYGLSFSPALGAWQLLGLAADFGLSDTRRLILAYVRNNPGTGPRNIAQGTALDHDLIKQTVRRMAAESQLDTDGKGAYFIPAPPLPDQQPGPDPWEG